MQAHGVELYCPKCNHKCPPGASHEPCKKCGYGYDDPDEHMNSIHRIVGEEGDQS